MVDEGGKGASSMDEWDAESLRCCSFVSTGGIRLIVCRDDQVVN